jgi:hypothetical protein
MTLKITHKHGTTAGTPPAAGDIDVGELAINAADAVIYTKDTAGAVQPFKRKFLQSGTGAVPRLIESKLQDVVSVRDFGAVGDGSTDDTAAIQASLDAWVANEGSLIFPQGNYIITQPLVVTFSTNRTGRTLISGYGATIDATSVTGDALTFTITGAQTLVRNLVIEGLQINADQAVDQAAFVLQGPGAADSYFYNNVLRDLTIAGFTGIKLLGNVFESSVENCNIKCPINTSNAGYPIFLSSSGGSGPSGNGIISSITLYQNTTRGGLNGVLSENDVSDVCFVNGTYLQAWNEGIKVRNAQQGYIKGAHIEACQLSQSSSVDGKAGIKTEVSLNYGISDITVINQSGKFMTNAIFAFVQGTGNVIIQGVSTYNITAPQVYLQGSAVNTSSATLIGNISYQVLSNVSVSRITGLRLIPPIESSSVNNFSGSASYTPSSGQAVLDIALSGATNPVINAPSFTPQDGDELEFIFDQAGSGGNTVTWDPVYLPGDFVPTATFGRMSTIRFRYVRKTSSSNNKVWLVISTATS